MSLYFDMPPMLGGIFSDSQLAGDHRVLPGDAVRVIDSFMAGFSSERASMAS